MAYVALIAVLAPGCGDYYDGDGITICPQRVETTRPRADSDDVYVRAPIAVTLECPVTEPFMTVAPLNGTPVPGLLTLHHGDRQVRWEPEPPLANETTYEAHLDTTAGFRDWVFRTDRMGLPTGTTDLAGAPALAFVGGRGTVLDPPGLTDALGEDLDAFNAVLQFTSNVAGGTVNARLGGYLPAEEGDPQDPGQPVYDYAAGWSDPVVTFGPRELVWGLDGWDLVLHDATLTAAVAPDLQGGGGGELSGLWDVRDVPASIFAEDPCAAAAAFDVLCAACPDGERTCLPFRFVHLPANPWFGPPLVAR